MLGAYAWISLALVVATALLRRASGFAVLVAAPLLLTAGTWTFDGSPARIVEVIIPAGIPAAGLRASLREIYWPSVGLPWDSINEALPNIVKPALTLSYGAGVRHTHARRLRRAQVLVIGNYVSRAVRVSRSHFVHAHPHSVRPLGGTGSGLVHAVQTRRDCSTE